LYGAVAVVVSQAGKDDAVKTVDTPRADVTVNPMVDDLDGDADANSPASTDAGVAEEPVPAQEADSTSGTPGPFVLAIALFVGAFIAAMVGVATNEWQEGLVSQASGTYEDFDSFETFATAVLPGDPGSFRLLVPSGGVTANQTISVPDLQRLKIEGLEPEAFSSMQNSASLEVAPLYGGDGQAFRVLGGGRLDLLFLTIANRTETTGCGGDFDVPCCDTDMAQCPIDQQLGGAAVFVAAGGLLTATRVLFRDLHVAGDGGAIVSYGVLQVRQSWFFDCTANRWGGALAPLERDTSTLLAGMTNIVEDSMFVRCTAESGGAIDVGVPNFRLARSNFVDNRIECSAPPYEADVCHSSWFEESSSDTHPRGDQLSTAVFWFGHDGYGQPCSDGCEAGCGGPDKYSGTCWENDLIVSIPAAAPVEEVRGGIDCVPHSAVAPIATRCIDCCSSFGQHTGLPLSIIL
jgi:hypothetical protein